MSLVALLDHYELMIRLVEQMIQRGMTNDPQFAEDLARKQAARLAVERFVWDHFEEKRPAQ